MSTRKLQKRSRNWNLTFQLADGSLLGLQPVKQALEAVAVLASTQCISAQLELAPTTSKHHIQAFFSSSSQRSLRAVRKLFLPLAPHVEAVHTTPRLAYAYCLKDDSHVQDEDGNPVFRYVYGEQPAGAGKRTALQAFGEAVEAGTVTTDSLYNEHAMVHARYPAYAYKVIAHNVLRNFTYSLPKQVIVITGPSGTGKTRLVHHLAQGSLYTAEIDKRNYWFDGYHQERIVLFDEFDGHNTVSLPRLLKLLDRYIVRVPVKGGFTAFAPTTIYIINNYNYNPSDWASTAYPDAPASAVAALNRRITSFIPAIDSGWGQLLCPPLSDSSILIKK